jgi:hypothetical protein
MLRPPGLIRLWIENIEVFFVDVLAGKRRGSMRLPLVCCCG